MSFDRKAYNKAYNKAYCEANREKIKARKKAYYEANHEEMNAKQKAYYEANREKKNAKTRAYQKANPEKIRAYKKAYNEANREKAKAYREANREKRNAKRNAWRKDRYYRDPLFKLTNTYRNTMRRGFKSVCSKKDIKSIDCLGCSWEEFQDHIQSQFYDRAETGEKMTLENHGYYGWHLDHIAPISSAKTEEDVIRLSHYTNFQPLWAEDNLEKGDYFLDNIEQIS
jgi:membrane protein involved in colicin uptake